MMKYLIVGLGNIGEKYAMTRHNIGFDIVDLLAATKDAHFESKRYAWRSHLKIKGRELIIIKPTTYMNLSGNAVRYWLMKERIADENLLVVFDDVALPLGELRLRKKGGAGGHNGLQHIIDVLGTGNFSRLRFGIGNDFSRGYQANFVLSPWSEEELPDVKIQCKRAVDVITSFVTIGPDRTMNIFNKSGNSESID